jgi:hypothetical protein
MTTVIIDGVEYVPREEKKEEKVDWQGFPCDPALLPQGMLLEVSATGDVWVKRYFSHCINGWFYAYKNGATKSTSVTSPHRWPYARIVENEPVAWFGEEECPVPDGLLVKITYGDGGVACSTKVTTYPWSLTYGNGRIAAYQILSLSEEE